MADSLNKQGQSDVGVTLEDQQMINLFSRSNIHFLDAKEKIKDITDQLENITEAEQEVELLDEDLSVPIQIGQTFVHYSQEGTAEYLNQLKDKLQERLDDLQATATEKKETMTDLKTKLYAKFGNAINLESEEA